MEFSPLPSLQICASSSMPVSKGEWGGLKLRGLSGGTGGIVSHSSKAAFVHLASGGEKSQREGQLETPE